MPDWNQILNKVKSAGSPQDMIRREYLAGLHAYTGRNVITYYSGWIRSPEARELRSTTRTRTAS